MRALGDALGAVLRGRRALLVASTDLSHYHDAAEAARLDGVVIDHVSRLDAEGLQAALDACPEHACGGGPMVAVMRAARLLGARDVGGAALRRLRGRLRRQVRRRRLSGGRARQLLVITPTGEKERVLLLRIARDAITAHVTGPQSAVGSHQSEDVEAAALASRRTGVFVTLHRAGELRGCIGHIEADRPLPVNVARCAVAACSEDPRFPAVSPSELPEIQLEISLLGPMEPAAGPADIEVGRHGLMVEMGRQRGLLLPQVATEHGWDAATFLSQTCRKAGLAKDIWQRGATVWRFEAEVFGDAPAH